MKTRSEITLVSGMHRSGTSLISSMLNSLDFFTGNERDSLKTAGDNVYGFFENSKFVKINEKILRLLDSSWKDISKIDTSAERYMDIKKSCVEKIRSQIMEISKDASHIVLKDPRISILLPIWKEALADFEAKYIVMFRHPLEVYMSLDRREHIQKSTAMALWYDYNDRLVKGSDQKRTIYISYDSLLCRPFLTLELILHFLNFPYTSEHLHKALDLFDPEEKHHNISLMNRRDTDIPPKIRGLYKELLKIEQAEFESFSPKFPNLTRRKRLTIRQALSRINILKQTIANMNEELRILRNYNKKLSNMQSQPLYEKLEIQEKIIRLSEDRRKILQSKNTELERDNSMLRGKRVGPFTINIRDIFKK